MTDRTRALKLIEKGFKCGYFRYCYGEIIAVNTGNYHTPYPYTHEETMFLLKYFGYPYLTYEGEQQ